MDALTSRQGETGMFSDSFVDGVLGGLGLFLLGAWLLAEGFEQGFGLRLRARWFGRGDERLRAWSSGALLSLGSPLSESSSRAIAGMANSGLMRPVHLLWCAAGHIAGPAVMAWIFVCLAGTSTADALALALVAGGVAALWTAPEKMRGAVGRAVVGAGLLLFGIDLIAGGFEHARGILRLDGFPGGVLMRAAALAVVGAGVAAGLRSATATVVLAAAASRSEALGNISALAVALGALLASAWGALLALDSGTLAARRAAVGVIGVHLLAFGGGVALVLGLGPALQSPPGFLIDPARAIALVLAMVILIPLPILHYFDEGLVALCSRYFYKEKGGPLAPQFVDGNLRALPPLAFQALIGEVGHLHEVARGLAASVLAREPVTGRREKTDRAKLRELAEVIEDGCAQLARRPLDAHSAAALPAIARAVQAAWELGEQTAWLHAEGLVRGGGPLGQRLESRLLSVQMELARFMVSPEMLEDGRDATGGARAELKFAQIERSLREIRLEATQLCTDGKLSACDLEVTTERLATLRRLAQLSVDSAADLMLARGTHGTPWADGELTDEGLGALASSSLH